MIRKRFLVRIISRVSVVLLASFTTGACLLSWIQGIRPVRYGSVTGYSYSDIYSSPADISAGYPVQVILHLTGENTDEIYVTEADGSYTITDIEVGTYTIAPVFYEDDYSVSVVIVADAMTTADDISFPSDRIEAYVFRANANAVSDLGVRQALAGAISVTDLVEYTDDVTRSAAINFIPSAIAGAWAQSSTFFEFDHDQSLASGITTPVAATILHNTSESHAGRASLAAAAMSALTDVTVTTSEVNWEMFLQAISAGDFEIARFGWAIDGNNVIPMFEAIADASGFSNAPFDEILIEAQAAVELGDLDTFQAKVVEANNAMVANCIALPIHFRGSSTTSPLEMLDGAWSVDLIRSDGLSPENDSHYVTISFDTATTSPAITIADSSFVVFETNRIDSLSGTLTISDQFSLEVTMTQQDYLPGIVGGTNYWEYYLIGDLLVADVFDDDTRSTRFVRFVGTR